MPVKHASRSSDTRINLAGLEVLVASLPVGAIALDAEKRVRLCNPTAARMLRQDASAMLGKELAQVIPSEQLHRAIDALLQIGDGNTTRQVAIEGEGAELLLEISVHSVTAKADQTLRHIIYFTDRTEEARSQRMRSDFVANASHELRTPLSTMKAAVETLLESADRLDAHQCRFLELLAKNVDRLEELARDLLELNRVESPNLQVSNEAVPLAPLLEEIRSIYADKLASDGIAFDTALGISNVCADGRLLKLILLNLIDNAVKFVTPGSGEILIRSSSHNERTVIEVVDNGVGIPAADRQRVFERFFQVDQARQKSGRPGTGLGLAIVRHAVTAMGGSVELTDAPVRGTRVTLTLPNQRQIPPIPPLPASTGLADGGPANT